MEECDVDSENEGQLLIDESVDGSKRPRRARAEAPRPKKATRKKRVPLKLAVKTPKTVASKRKKAVEMKSGSNSAVKSCEKVRTSTRVIKRSRKMSPSPPRTKKEQTKKRLKVRIKNVPKSSRKAKGPLRNVKSNVANPKKQDAENVDIEAISDDEPPNIHYSSVIIDEDIPEKERKLQEPMKKAGIKLKLSLGKVLTPKAAESLQDKVQKIDDSEKSNSSPSLEQPQVEKHVKPLILSKRRVSNEVANSQTSYDISSVSLENPHTQRDREWSSEAGPPYCKTSSEDHKPLTLRLSVGKPLKRSMSEFHKSQSAISAFPNIQRSWSIAPAKTPPDLAPEDAFDLGKVSPTGQKVAESIPSPDPPQNLSATPYFSAGLQSLLDVVSVEINEQNKNSPNDPNAPNSTKLSQNAPKRLSSLTNHPLANKITPKVLKPTSIERETSAHEGHLPSLTFPKPKLHFSTKKRPRNKPTINISSPQQPHPLSLLSSVVEVKGQSEDEEIAELTEKERRRRDKKKVLNADFVDPDSVIAANDEKSKPPKKRPIAQYTPKAKGGGFSLLMPQITSQSNCTEQKVLQLGTTCNLPSKSSIVSKRPKKGLATAKQRLANKLKIRKTFAY